MQPGDEVLVRSILRVTGAEPVARISPGLYWVDSDHRVAPADVFPEALVRALVREANLERVILSPSMLVHLDALLAAAPWLAEEFDRE